MRRSGRDHNLKFHEYKRKRPTKNVQVLLDHIGTSGDPMFWGSQLVPGEASYVLAASFATVGVVDVDGQGWLTVRV